jgi:hypothetical protein
MLGPSFDKWLPSGFNKIVNFIKRNNWKKYLRSKLPDGNRPLETEWFTTRIIDQDNSLRCSSGVS